MKCKCGGTVTVKDQLLDCDRCGIGAVIQINPWEPVSGKLLRRLGKTSEELGELSAVVGRMIIQGPGGTDPSSGRLNTDRLADEIADVYAQLGLLVVDLALDSNYISDRIQLKKASMAVWEAHFPEGEQQ